MPPNNFGMSSNLFANDHENFSIGLDFIVNSLLTRSAVYEIEECTSRGSRFHATKVPKISLAQYLQRIMRYCPASNTALVVSLIYLYRMMGKCGKTFLNAHTLHRQLILSVVVASKFCDDFFETNTFYARVGGISVSELNALELEFLARMSFDLHVNEDEFLAYQNFIHTAASLSTDKSEEKFELELQKKFSSALTISPESCSFQGSLPTQKQNLVFSCST